MIVIGYLAVMAALLGVCVVAGPAGVAVAWCAVGLISAGAIIVGVRRHAPLRPVPWWLLAGSILAMTVGDLAFGVVTDASASGPPSQPPMLANICYLAMFPLMMASFAILTQASVVFRDRGRLLDMLTVTCAAALLVWVFLIVPTLNASFLGTAERSLMAGYVLGSLVVMVISARLVFAARRSAAVLLLTAGASGLLASNLAYAWLQLGDGWQSREPTVLGYVVMYVTWGVAALHPSMVELTAPVDTRPERQHGRWAVWLRVCLAVPAVTLLAQAMTGGIHDGVVIAIASVLMCELVVTRLSDMVGKYRRAVARERGLREACGALVAAVDRATVVEAVRAAVGRLVPPGVGHRVVVAIRDGLAAGDGAATGPDPAAELGSVTAPAPAVGDGSRLLRTRLLHPRLRDALGRSGMTLVCPLDAYRNTPATADAGTLLVSAPGPVLETIRDSVEVLAAQATLAMERILLNDVISRRDGDRYLRSVVQNTEDVVLVVDHDDRLRYASPSLLAVLGVDPAGCASLWDIVHAEDREQVVRTRARAERCAGRPDTATGAAAGTAAGGTADTPTARPTGDTSAGRRTGDASVGGRTGDASVSGRAGDASVGGRTGDAVAGGTGDSTLGGGGDVGGTGDVGGARDLWSLRRPDGRRALVEVTYRDLRRDRMVRGFVITIRDVTEHRRHEQEMVRQALRQSGAWQNRLSSLHRFR